MNQQFQQTAQAVQGLSAIEQIELIKLIFANLVAKPNDKLTLFETIFQLLRDMFYPISEADLSPTVRNGVPLFPKQPGAEIVTLDIVNELRDELV